MIKRGAITCICLFISITILFIGCSGMTPTQKGAVGWIRKLIYGLYPGEAMWQLKIEKSEQLNNS
jgi:hypothetical protein